MKRSKQLARAASALIMGLALASGAAAQAQTGAGASPPPAADQPQGEPLPPGAPTDPYELTGWCYGALAEYLQIYDQVKPELVAIDKLFGSPVKEAEPYQSDVKAYHDELKVFGETIVAAEKASPQVISNRGAAAIRSGQGIWQQAEQRNRRELAHAWLSWGMPDACDTNARKLLASASLLGKALKYNQGHAEAAQTSGPTSAAATGDQGGGSDGGGALVLAPIAPVVTHDAAAPAPPPPVPAMAGATRVPDDAAPVPSPTASADQPPATATVATAEPPPASAPAETPAPAEAPAATSSALAASAQPSRVIGEPPPSAAAPASAEPPAPSRPAETAAIEPQPAAAPSPRPSAPAASTALAPMPAATADEPQEPVL